MSQWHRDMVAQGAYFAASLKGDTCNIVDQNGTVLFLNLKTIARELTQKEVIKFGGIGVVDYDKVFEISRQLDGNGVQFNCSSVLVKREKVQFANNTFETSWAEQTDDGVVDPITTLYEASVITLYCKDMNPDIGEMANA